MDRAAFQNIQLKLNLTNDGVSEALDVELFTVQQWACGMWPVPRPIVKFLRTLLEIKRNNFPIRMNGYREGYQEGLIDGQRRGYKGSDGKLERTYKSGYENGHHDGHVAGYAAGQKEGRREGEDKVGYAHITELSMYADGYSDGHREGKEAGRSTGYTEGYTAAMKAVGIG